MTGLEKLCRANRWRKASTAAEGWNGHFLVPVDGQLWWVTLNDRQGWKRLTVQGTGQRVIPDSRVLIQLKNLFFDDESWVVQFYLPVNVQPDPYRVDLWEPLDKDLPTPTPDERSSSTQSD